jgi:hypothetical protein
LAAAGVEVEVEAVVVGLLLNDSLNFCHALLKPFFSFFWVVVESMTTNKPYAADYIRICIEVDDRDRKPTSRAERWATRSVE